MTESCSLGLHSFKSQFSSLKKEDNNNGYILLTTCQVFHIRYFHSAKQPYKLRAIFSFNKGGNVYKAVEEYT